MHTTFRIGGTTLMASDGCEEGPSFGGFSLHLSLPTEAEADRAFAALAADGQVRMPLTKTFWSPRFGMLTDRFGLGWMISVAAEMTGAKKDRTLRHNQQTRRRYENEIHGHRQSKQSIRGGRFAKR